MGFQGPYRSVTVNVTVGRSFLVQFSAQKIGSMLLKRSVHLTCSLNPTLCSRSRISCPLNLQSEPTTWAENTTFRPIVHRFDIEISEIEGWFSVGKSLRSGALGSLLVCLRHRTVWSLQVMRTYSWKFLRRVWFSWKHLIDIVRTMTILAHFACLRMLCHEMLVFARVLPIQLEGSVLNAALIVRVGEVHLFVMIISHFHTFWMSNRTFCSTWFEAVRWCYLSLCGELIWRWNFVFRRCFVFRRTLYRRLWMNHFVLK